MAMRKREEGVVFPNAAGIDVGASSHWVAVPRHASEEPVREFGAMTDDLNALADTGDFRKITARINGGQIGAADRNARYAKARRVFGA